MMQVTGSRHAPVLVQRQGGAYVTTLQLWYWDWCFTTILSLLAVWGLSCGGPCAFGAVLTLRVAG